jgi:hypothetical protein
MSRYSKLRISVGAGFLTAAALAAVFVVLSPADAQSVVKQLISFTCADHQSCISITNTSRKGMAIVGVAQNNAGVVGHTDINTNKDPNNILPANGGVWGVDESTNQLDTNSGVLGTSVNGSGVTGVATFDSSVNLFGQAGVNGFDLLNKAGGNNVGVYGQSYYSTAVFGLAINLPGTGVEGVGQNGAPGMFGEAVDTISQPGVGTVGQATYGIGMEAAGGGKGANPALLAFNFGGGDPMRAYAGNGGPAGKFDLVMRLDRAGNMTLEGTLTQNGLPMSVNPTSTGGKVVTYAAQQSVPTLEDVGEGQLIHGQAAVSLERTFASAIDRRRSYLVFITPQGDSNGLYVLQKSASGFVVREHNGVSNIAFDYRIVAQPYGSLTQRLPTYVTPNEAPGAASRYVMNRLRSSQRVRRLQY